jgi:hypothetical protein
MYENNKYMHSQKVEFETSPILCLVTLIYCSRSLGYSWRRLSYSPMQISNRKRTSLMFGILSWFAEQRKAYKGSNPFNTYCIVSHHVKLERQECVYLPSCVELNLLSMKPDEDIHVMNLSLRWNMLSRNI